MDITEVELNISIPREKVGLVIMQSMANLSPGEPYRWTNGTRTQQIQNIRRTLQIAKSADHEATHTHFTVFPEYSVPGLDGIREIYQEAASANWPSNSVIIAGVDGLSHTDYTSLCSEADSRIAVGSEPANITADHWINCLVVCVKNQNGQVSKFVQSKLAGAWPEQLTPCNQMHCGNSMFLFKGAFDNGQTCRFFGLICFDWIGKDRSDNLVWSAVLQKLCDLFPGDGIELNWIFVLQENRQPNHPNFLTVAKAFFEERNQYTLVNRDNCALVFANNSGIDKPGECATHGCSSLVFSQQVTAFQIRGTPLTFSGSPTTTRGTEILSSCNDVVFRESGACIHSFSMRPPKFVSGGTANKCLPLIRACVHSLDANLSDPRAPGLPVPGC